ncbi:alpha/beta fold hydrolase, partial [Porticoccus sp.]
MKLNYQIQGAGEPVILMHGMFGSLSNLGLVGRALIDHYQVISVDLRNHGESPHAMEMDYPSMADDIVELMDHLGIPKAHLLGHSMGGKAAMQLALTQPELIGRLIVADIAPVAYGHSQAHLTQAMRRLDLTGLTSRSEADQRLTA